MVGWAIILFATSKQWAADAINTLIPFWARIRFCTQRPASAINAGVSRRASIRIGDGITSGTTYAINTDPTKWATTISAIRTEDWR